MSAIGRKRTFAVSYAAAFQPVRLMWPADGYKDRTDQLRGLRS